MSKTLYSWTFDDTKNRSALWYTIALSIVIGLSIWGFFTAQYGMSFIVLLIAGLAYFLENNSDDVIQVQVTELGILVGESFYEYTKIASHGYIYSGAEPILLRLQLTKKGIRIIDLKVNKENVMELKNILPNYTEEDTQGELTFSEKFIRKINL